MKNVILPILLWIISFSQLFSQEPLASIQAHTELFNDTNIHMSDSTGYHIAYMEVALEQKLEIISSTEEDQVDPEVADAFFMFPNPTSGMVQVKLPGKISVYIYSLTGQLIKRFYLTRGDLMLDLTDLPAGMYQVRAKSDDDYYSGKLLVQ